MKSRKAKAVDHVLRNVKKTSQKRAFGCSYQELMDVKKSHFSQTLGTPLGELGAKKLRNWRGVPKSATFAKENLGTGCGVEKQRLLKIFFFSEIEFFSVSSSGPVTFLVSFLKSSPQITPATDFASIIHS